MEEHNMRVLALLCSVAGLVILYFSSALAEQAATPVALNSIAMDDAGTSVKVCGNITSCKTTNGHVFLQLLDTTGTLRLVVFNTTAIRINASCSLNGRSACAMGQIQEYPPGSGSIEMIASMVI